MNTAKLRLVAATFLFGTIGLFVKDIPLPSSMTALVRGVVGMSFLLVVLLMRGGRLDRQAVRQNLWVLLLSGGCLGFNWILLFESYRYTSVAVSTLCYYMAPILVLAASPLVLGETLSRKKALCILAALAGMVGVSGVVGQGLPSAAEGKGIGLGLAAAVLYACIIVLNKRLRGISAYDKTILQLGISAAVLLPYCLLTVPASALQLTPASVGLLLLVGVVHTGVTYYLYFGAMDGISGQSVAIISYVDPVVAVLCSVLLLREPLQLPQAVGALLILGAALAGELPAKEKTQ